MMLKSLAHAALLSVGVLLPGVMFGANELLFSPVGFAAILGSLFLELLGNRW